MTRSMFDVDIGRYVNPYTYPEHNFIDSDLYWHNRHQYRNIASGRERAFTQFGHGITDYRDFLTVITTKTEEQVPDHQITMWDRIMYVKCKIMVRFGQWLIRITTL